MTYVEGIAVDLARMVGAQPGSMMFHGIVGALKEVVERCAVEASEALEVAGAMDRIRALAAPPAGVGAEPEPPRDAACCSWCGRLTVLSACGDPCPWTPAGTEAEPRACQWRDSNGVLHNCDVCAPAGTGGRR